MGNDGWGALEFSRGLANIIAASIAFAIVCDFAISRTMIFYSSAIRALWTAKTLHLDWSYTYTRVMTVKKSLHGLEVHYYPRVETPKKSSSRLFYWARKLLLLTPARNDRRKIFLFNWVGKLFPIHAYRYQKSLHLLEWLSHSCSFRLI